MTKIYKALSVIAIAFLIGYSTPEKVSAQLPAVLFGTSSGQIQAIKSTGGALWVTVGGGSVTTDTIIASDTDGIGFEAYIPDIDGDALTPALAGDGAGNLTNGVYSYKFTVETAEGETAVGTATPTVTVVDKTVDGKVLVQLPLTYNAGQLTRLNIYRTAANGVVYKKVCCAVDLVAPFATEFYTDNIADASLGVNAPSTNTTIGVRYTLVGEVLVPTYSDWWLGSVYELGDPRTGTDVFVNVHDAVGDNAGPWLDIKAGNSANNDGGNLNLAGGNSVNGAGGDMSLQGGPSDTQPGGDISLTGGRSGSHNGGDIAITGGEADADNLSGPGRTGGDITLTGGSGVAGSGTGGDLNLFAGAGVSNPGDVNLAAGSANNGGDVNIDGADSTSITNGNGGEVTITGGNGAGASGGGGQIVLNAGNGSGGGGAITLQSQSANASASIHAASPTASLDMGGDAAGRVSVVTGTDGFYLNGNPIERWTTPGFNAGDYTASGSMTWTVASGDVTTNQYIRIGNMLIWNLVLDTTTVAGTPSTQLRVDIPGSVTLTKTCVSFSAQNDNGTEAGGDFVGIAGNSYIYFNKIPASNWTASTNNTAVYAQIICEVS